MNRGTAVWIVLNLLGTAMSTCSLAAAQAAPAPLSSTASAGIRKIQHIIFIIKENRSFDQYFGTFPGAEGATSGTISTGQVISLGHTPDQTPYDLGHGYAGLVSSIDSGNMDRFDLIEGGNNIGDYLSYTEMTQADIPNYFTYASKFVLADRMFSSLHSPSFPNHLFTVGAQSGGAFNNPSLPHSTTETKSWGCDADASVTVPVMDAMGNITAQYPCFDFPTLADSLENASISWRYYAPQPGETAYIWSTLDAINHIRNSSLWSQRVVPSTQFITDITNGQLPAVSWLVVGAESEHPPNSVCEGENWTVKQLNALMQSQYWNSSAVFLTWDDFGGFYDHVPPPLTPSGTFGYGARVPLLIISPYAKSGYISHTQYEFSSVLKFIEERFALPPLTDRDANANDTLDSFDFSQTPIPPFTLKRRSCPLVSALDVALGRETVGQTRTYQMRMLNVRGVPVRIFGFSVNGDFGQTNNCPSTLEPRASCNISVSFTPTVTGSRTGTLMIDDDDSAGSEVVQLHGIGSEASIDPPYPGINFGYQALGGTSQPKTATLTNTGTRPLSLLGITTIGNYKQTNTCGSSLKAGASCRISVSFAPQMTGLLYGNLAILDDDPGSPHTVRLLGNGTDVVLSRSGLTFGNQTAGTTSPAQNITLTNAGPSTLTFASIVASGDFAQTNNCAAGVLSRASCTISVTFTPTKTGARKGLITLSDSDGTSPQKITLTGTGT